MGEQEEGKDDGRDWRVGESGAVRGGPRRKEEAVTKTRAIEGEEDGRHARLEPASQPRLKSVLQLFVCLFAFLTCSHIARRLF